MKITYDHEVDALYIRFKETTVTTRPLAEGIAADYDAEGRLAGIEILDAAERLGGRLLSHLRDAGASPEPKRQGVARPSGQPRR